MRNSKVLAVAVASIILATGSLTSAQSTPTQGQRGQMVNKFQGHRIGGQGRPMMSNRVVGIISAINGTTLTITGNNFGKNENKVVYTVDATNAKVEKNKVVSSISNLVVGDKVFVEGTVNGTSVTATNISITEKRPIGTAQDLNKKKPEAGSPRNTMVKPPMLEGNGQPIVGGTVTAVSGTIVTITNKSNVAYTIESSSAKITKDGKESSVSGIIAGDTLLVQGTINGTSVNASTITDQGAKPKVAEGTGANQKPVNNGGFFRGIGNFFSKLFGF